MAAAVCEAIDITEVKSEDKRHDYLRYRYAFRRCCAFSVRVKAEDNRLRSAGQTYFAAARRRCKIDATPPALPQPLFMMPPRHAARRAMPLRHY